MWKKFALLSLLVILNACAESLQSAEEGAPGTPPPKGDGLLKQQIVNAQEQNARLEVRVSKFDAQISSLKNEIRGMETQQLRMSEKIDRLDHKLDALAASMSSPFRPRGNPRKSTKRGSKSIPAVRRPASQVSRLPSQSSGSAGNSPSTIVPQAPVIFRSSNSPANEVASLSPREAYNRAYRSVREKKNRQAILLFEAFLRQFPKNPLAANAQYWLGESYYDMRDFPTSLKEFQKVIRLYPTSRKVPDALYKKGLTYLQIKDFQKAAMEFEKLIQRYPDHPLSARARQRIRTIRQTNPNNGR